jgi:ArsR family transcriptional regulator
LNIVGLVVAISTPSASSRAELFRLLGDEDRLRLLALCAEEELTVGELAALLDEAQPQLTRKSQPLRDAGLLKARKDGTRTLLSAHLDAAHDAAIAKVALDEGRALCMRDGSLAKVAAIVRAREEHARKFFDSTTPSTPSTTAVADALAPLLSIVAPLLPGRALAVDAGTGEGALLPLLSPLYERVIAVDRSPARLARCAERVAALGLANVRLREGDVEDATLLEEVSGKGGADLVLVARVLHHAARPHEAVSAAASLLKRGGHLAVVDYLPHDDEAMRDEGDVWLGFDPLRLRAWLTSAELDVVALHPISIPDRHPLQIAVGKKEKHDGRSH